MSRRHLDSLSGGDSALFFGLVFMCLILFGSFFVWSVVVCPLLWVFGIPFLHIYFWESEEFSDEPDEQRRL